MQTGLNFRNERGQTLNSVSSNRDCTIYRATLCSAVGLLTAFIEVAKGSFWARRLHPAATPLRYLAVPISDLQNLLGVPRHERFCLACNSASVCDEMHMIFECPALKDLREKYSHLFSGNITTMKQFMWQENIFQTMLFVRDCLDMMLA